MIFLISGFSTIVFAQTYLWPTNSSKYLASSFCEYRPGHYHAAIDIKTWNKEGYECYAVEDAKIHRIKLSTHGAGKALYLKLKDGRFAVYFHLQKFPDKIEAELRNLQIQQKKYSVEWWPKDWSVKKGEIVAFTGQTGIGVPHLHFEIRNASNVPINPIPFFKDVKDQIRPQLKRLLVIPQEKNSTVNGSFIPRSYSLTYIRNGIFVIDEPIYAEGLIGLAINGYDQANDVSNKLGFYSTDMTVSGVKVFNYSYDEVSFKETGFVDIDIFYPEKIKTGERYNKLFLEDFNRLSFYDRTVGNGLLIIKNVNVPFETEVKDFFGNVSILRGTILPYPQQPLEPNQINTFEGAAFIKLFIPDSVKSIGIYSNVQKDEKSKIQYFEIINRHPMDGGTQALVKIRLPHDGISMLYVETENKHNKIHSTQIKINNLVQQKIQFESWVMGRHLYFSFPELKGHENLNVEIEHNGRLSQSTLNTQTGPAELVIDADEINSDSIRISIKNYSTSYVDTTIHVNKMIPIKNQKFSFYGNKLMLESKKDSPYEALFFEVKSMDLSGENFDLPTANEAFLIDGGGFPLNRKINISIKPDSSLSPLNKTSVYSLDDGELEYEGGSFNPQTGYITISTRKFDTYLLAADTTAPVIEIKSPSKVVYNNLPDIIFKVDDATAGIGDDENIEIYFDDQYIVSEWDPERDLVIGKLHFEPTVGDHIIRISVRDRVGNRVEEILTVKVQ